MGPGSTDILTDLSPAALTLVPLLEAKGLGYRAAVLQSPDRTVRAPAPGQTPPGTAAAGLVALGAESRLQGRYAEASELYRRALALEPGQLEASVGAAVVLFLQGNAPAAVQRLIELTGLHPDSAPAWTTLGDVYRELGRFRAALECYEHVLDDDPGSVGCRLGLARCLSRRPLLAPLLRSPRRVVDCLAAGDVDADLLTQAAAALLRVSPSPLEEPLLPAILRRAVLTDLGLEQALTRLRRQLCLEPPHEEPGPAAALAAQCRLNESAWAVSPEEEARLAAAPAWVRAMYEPEEVSAELRERARRIPTLTPVCGGASAEVRDLYEANPYPRWRELSRAQPLDLDQNLRLLAAGAWEPPAFLKRPRLLVAGCGTGRDLLGGARTWRPAAVTGFDLSRTSLAYAQQMSERFGIEVELYHADLLRLDGWEREFDAIVCTGVLHHLEDPMAGWRRLLHLLRPGGVMLVGLYSETARRGIAAAQAEVRRMGVPPTAEGIRAARTHLAALPQDDPASGCTVLRDFYYLSGCRDMLFHVREHRFTLARVAAALDELGLTFLAFEIDGAVRHLYRTLFGVEASLACWEKLEQLYPSTFLGMYQFWCQLPDGRTT